MRIGLLFNELIVCSSSTSEGIRNDLFDLGYDRCWGNVVSLLRLDWGGGSNWAWYSLTKFWASSSLSFSTTGFGYSWSPRGIVGLGFLGDCTSLPFPLLCLVLFDRLLIVVSVVAIVMVPLPTHSTKGLGPCPFQCLPHAFSIGFYLYQAISLEVLAWWVLPLLSISLVNALACNLVIAFIDTWAICPCAIPKRFRFIVLGSIVGAIGLRIEQSLYKWSTLQPLHKGVFAATAVVVGHQVYGDNSYSSEAHGTHSMQWVDLVSV